VAKRATRTTPSGMSVADNQNRIMEGPRSPVLMPPPFEEALASEPPAYSGALDPSQGAGRILVIVCGRPASDHDPDVRRRSAQSCAYVNGFAYGAGAAKGLGGNFGTWTIAAE
jgi:hypothetical protein